MIFFKIRKRLAYVNLDSAAAVVNLHLDINTTRVYVLIIYFKIRKEHACVNFN